MRLASALVAGLALAGCHAAPPAKPASAPASAPPAASKGPPIWDVAAGRAMTPDAYRARLASARIVLLGEKHDDPEHHRLEAAALHAVYAAHRARPPAVAFEMVDESKQPAIDAFLATRPASAAPLEEILQWKTSHWPAWELYAPVFQEAIDAHAPILGASPPFSKVHAIMRGAEAAPPLPALPEAEVAQMHDEMREVHCQKLPDEMVDGMVTAQRLKDATMAEHLREAVARTGGAVLVAGNGHVRKDRGVGWLLRSEGVLVVAFLEAAQPDAPPPAPLPYDIVVLTPPAGERDPCHRD